MKTNFLGSEAMIFGTGYNPSDAKKDKNLKLRNLIATVEYETNLFQSGKPRAFKVYLLKKGISYYDLSGIKQYD